VGRQVEPWLRAGRGIRRACSCVLLRAPTWSSRPTPGARRRSPDRRRPPPAATVPRWSRSRSPRYGSRPLMTGPDRSCLWPSRPRAGLAAVVGYPVRRTVRQAFLRRTVRQASETTDVGRGRPSRAAPERSLPELVRRSVRVASGSTEEGRPSPPEGERWKPSSVIRLVWRTPPGRRPVAAPDGGAPRRARTTPAAPD
jgi:hypothetical protein